MTPALRNAGVLVRVLECTATSVENWIFLNGREVKQMNSARLIFMTFVACTCSSVALSEKDWKVEAEEWKSEAMMWKQVAESYQDKYGWIAEQYGFCSMNRGIFLSSYAGPTCVKPAEPWCSFSIDGCAEWQVVMHKHDLEQWFQCRQNYVREAQQDAGCAIALIKDGIEEAIVEY